MRVALYGKKFSGDDAVYLQRLFDKLNNYATTLNIYKPFFDNIKSYINVGSNIKQFSGYKELEGNVDFLLSIGGDGTLLDTVTLVRDSGIPILGINLGRLGFISSVSKHNIDKALDDLDKGKYSLEKRSLLRLETAEGFFGDLNYALNELTINKKDTASMILIHVWVDDNFINSYWADGLIISTPTGSTGYSLSCNGPIITPDSENFVITPIATHNLTVRPIVIPDKSVIDIKVEGRHQQFLAGLDSRSEVIDASTRLRVRKEIFSVNLLLMEGENFFRTIREKLMWGLDIRN
ncbi:MAG: NAD kinase [Bacteroidales bacterium]|nr:NAD kinase [Bacteroidales bacterium]